MPAKHPDMDPSAGDEELKQMIAAEDAAKASEADKAAKQAKSLDGAEGKTFPVRLLKNYRPAGRFEILDVEGNWQGPPAVEGGQDIGLTHKMKAGQTIKLPLAEAKNLIAKRIAERADELPS